MLHTLADRSTFTCVVEEFGVTPAVLIRAIGIDVARDVTHLSMPKVRHDRTGVHMERRTQGSCEVGAMRSVRFTMVWP